jgi:hypothetical protein
MKPAENIDSDCRHSSFPVLIYISGGPWVEENRYWRKKLVAQTIDGKNSFRKQFDGEKFC